MVFNKASDKNSQNCNYSSNEIRKTQNNHLSKFDKVCSREFKANFLFFGVDGAAIIGVLPGLGAVITYIVSR